MPKTLDTSPDGLLRMMKHPDDVRLLAAQLKDKSRAYVAVTLTMMGYYKDAYAVSLANDTDWRLFMDKYVLNQTLVDN